MRRFALDLRKLCVEVRTWMQRQEVGRSKDGSGREGGTWAGIRILRCTKVPIDMITLSLGEIGDDMIVMEVHAAMGKICKGRVESGWRGMEV